MMRRAVEMARCDAVVIVIGDEACPQCGGLPHRTDGRNVESGKLAKMKAARTEAKLQSLFETVGSSILGDVGQERGC